MLRSLFTLPCYKTAGSENRTARRRCRICRKKTSYFCFSCSSVDNDLIVPLCNPIKTSALSKDRDNCYVEHVRLTLVQQSRLNSLGNNISNNTSNNILSSEADILSSKQNTSVRDNEAIIEVFC